MKESIFRIFLVMVLGNGLVFAQTEKLTGYVYVDSNKNGSYENGEEPLPNVSLSNGVDVVQTNAKGFYKIPLIEGAPVFVIKPSGYILGVTDNNISKMYTNGEQEASPYPRKGRGPEKARRNQVDFALYPNGEEDSLKIALLGDTQVKIMDDIFYVAKLVGEQLIDESVDFVVPLGDLVFDDLKLFEPLKQTLGKIGAPVYYVYGNHDRNYEATQIQDRDETYETHFGPSYYAFNYGKNAFLVLNTVFPENGTRKYEGRVDDRQLQFIRNYVRTLSTDTPIYLFMHIPLEQVSNLKALLEVFREHPNVSAYAGHTHTQYYRNFNKEDGWVHDKPLMELVAGAVCGSWWRGEKDIYGIPGAMMRDGTPRGYWIMDIAGPHPSYTYKVSGNLPQKQMHIWTPYKFLNEKVTSNQPYILANVYAGDDSTTVEVKIENGDWVVMDKVMETDPYYLRLVKLQELGITPTENGLSLGKKLPLSHHLWKIKVPDDLKAGVYRVEVRAKNKYGLDAMAKILLFVT